MRKCHACPEAVVCEHCEACAEHCSWITPNDLEGHRSQMTRVLASTDAGALVSVDQVGRQRPGKPN